MGAFVDEIQRLQRTVNLVDWALSHGWEKDKAKSSSGVIALRCGGVKVLAREKNEKPGWRFVECVGANLKGGQRGDVVNFVAWDRRISLAEAVRELGGYEGKIIPSSDSTGATEAPAKPADYREHLAGLWGRMSWIPNHPYLLRQRGLREALCDARFVDTYRQDHRGNAVFPLRDRDGLCGLEKRNVTFKGVEKWSDKALWYSLNLASATAIVICESPIECLSHAELYGGDFAYVSIGGNISRLQDDLIQGLVSKAESRGAAIIAAFNNDQGGREFTDYLDGLTKTIDVHCPIGKDWNEDLQYIRQNS